MTWTARPLLSLLTLVFALPTSLASAGAKVSFGPPRVFDAHDLTTNRTEGEPAVAGDGAGNWVAIWHSQEDLGVGAGVDFEPVVSTSNDDGGTWSSPILAKLSYPADFVSDIEPDLATDGAGTWVAIWNSGGGSLTEHCENLHDSDVQVARSLDNGATWSAETVLNSNAASEADSIRDECPRIAYGNGTWVTVWSSESSLSGLLGVDNDDSDVLYSISTDGGAMWSAAAPLNTDAASDAEDDDAASVASDGAGNWVVTWSRRLPTGRVAMVSTSGDDGATWSAPTVLSTAASEPVVAGGTVVATDKAGTWVAGWNRSRSNSEFLGLDIIATRSTNNGASWSTPVDVKPDPVDDNEIDLAPSLTAQGEDTFVMAFATTDPLRALGGGDDDVVMVVSEDGGQTWDAPEGIDALGVGDPGDDSDNHVAVAGDSSGSVVAFWRSRRVYGSGFDLHYNGTIHAARSRIDCPPIPDPGCLQPIGSGRSRLKIVDKAGGADKMLWRWGKGEETLVGDFGDPENTADHVLCLWETVAAVPTLRFEEDVEAGGACGVRPCWMPKADRFRYVDKPIDRGATKKLDLVAGDAGRAKLAWNGRKILLGPPRMPFDPAATVTMQLLNLETSVCWGAEFSSPKRNDPDSYSASSD